VISFIVPAHNEEAWIGRSLLAIREAMCAVPVDHEVIVVSDASTDQTKAIAREYGARVIQVGHRQISATRNAGAQDAHGDIFFFIDADTLIDSAAVRAALRAIHEGAAGGGCVPRFDGRLPLWFRIFYPLMVFTIRWVLRQTGGACLFCTRQAFAGTGGFSEEHYAAEEDVWVKALKPFRRASRNGCHLRAQSAQPVILDDWPRIPAAGVSRRGWVSPSRRPGLVVSTIARNNGAAKMTGRCSGRPWPQIK
jgi:glycosyltransferase involved in cell wall biosynthesis